MNDLKKEEEIHLEKMKSQESDSLAKESLSSTSLLQKKLKNFLLLLYQGYLKGETDIEPEIRSAFLSLVKQDEDFAFKVRMMQVDYLNLENVALEGKWDEATDVLFPITLATSKPVDERKKILIGYKETISDLLKSFN